MNLKKVNSHTVSFDHYGDVEREECYPCLAATVQRQERRVHCECDRYLASSGLTEWRILVREVEPSDGIGPVTRAGLRETALPLVEAWLKSEAYWESRRVAFAWALTQEARRIDTTADYRFKAAFTKHAHELTDEDHKRIERAAALRLESLHLLEGQPAGSWVQA